MQSDLNQPSSALVAGHRLSALLIVLAALFTLRVAGQALQRWYPLSSLPPFQSFQGSHLPYSILFPAQLLIIALMMRISLRIESGVMLPNPRVGGVLLWAGGAYLAFALGRLGVGVCWLAAPPWFRAWISDVFHLVLAGYVLTLGAWHRSGC